MLYVRNSLSGKKELFEPLNPPYVKMYACGITTYDVSHIGHAMQAMAFQMIRRYLEYSGYKVVYVRNYTDVDDKIIARAKESKMSASGLSKQIIEMTQKDFAELGIEPADHRPKVSEMIPQIISFIEMLIAKDFAYATPDGHVYFRVRNYPEYGKLSRRNIDDQHHVTRDTVVAGKEDPLDFALWKADSNETFSWQSPWGKGRPGWHIECSAMIHSILGEHIDIHGGGRDLVFPHHENEIAQSESCFGSPLAKYWLHSGLLSIDKQKMSKSLGNHISIRDFLKTYPAEVLKFTCLQHHYRLDMDLSHKAFMDTDKKLFSYYFLLEQVNSFLESHNTSTSSHPELWTANDSFYAKWKEEFCTSMDDDFNSVKAIAGVHKIFKDMRLTINSNSSDEDKINTFVNFQKCIHDIAKVFAVFVENPTLYMKHFQTRYLNHLKLSEDIITAKIEERQAARKRRDFTTADLIRDELSHQGILLNDQKDHPESTNWTFNFHLI
ncbi:MAG: cysteine--tRNA ligase [Proteobacteria bacterium]|nr:cysteine--tRNA ligase [Pseudomonadota bacterium]